MLISLFLFFLQLDPVYTDAESAGASNRSDQQPDDRLNDKKNIRNSHHNTYNKTVTSSSDSLGKTVRTTTSTTKRRPQTVQRVTSTSSSSGTSSSSSSSPPVDSKTDIVTVASGGQFDDSLNHFFGPDYETEYEISQPDSGSQQNNDLVDREHSASEQLQDQIEKSGKRVPDKRLIRPHDGLPAFPAPDGFSLHVDSHEQNSELTADGAGFVMEDGRPEIESRIRPVEENRMQLQQLPERYPAVGIVSYPVKSEGETVPQSHDQDPDHHDNHPHPQQQEQQQVSYPVPAEYEPQVLHAVASSENDVSAGSLPLIELSGPSAVTGANQVAKQWSSQRQHAIRTASSHRPVSGTRSRLQVLNPEQKQRLQSDSTSTTVTAAPLVPVPVIPTSRPDLSSVFSGQNVQQAGTATPPQTIRRPGLTHIPLGMPLPGILMSVANSDPHKQMSFAQQLASKMLQHSLSPRASLQSLASSVFGRRVKRSATGTSTDSPASKQIVAKDNQAAASAYFPFDEMPHPPLVFQGMDFGTASSNRRRSSSGSSGRRSGRGQRREAESSHRKSFGILGSGNFEVIRGGIYRDESEDHHSAAGQQSAHSEKGISSDDYDDATTGHKKYTYAPAQDEDSNPFVNERDGVFGFQGFDNFHLASNQEEDLKTMHETTSDVTGTAASRHRPVLVDSDQDLMATA